MVMSLLKSLYKSLYKNAKDPTLSILGHHGGRRKVASLRPPFSTPATPRDKPEPAGPFPSSIERAPPLFCPYPGGLNFGQIGSAPPTLAGRQNPPLLPTMLAPRAASCREDEFGSHAARRPSLWSLILHRSCTSLRFRVFWPSESEYKQLDVYELTNVSF